MRLVIDPEVCTGHGLCYAVAGALIAYDERGYGLVVRAELDASLMEVADRAVTSCPEQAISIVER